MIYYRINVIPLQRLQNGGSFSYQTVRRFIIKFNSDSATTGKGEYKPRALSDHIDIVKDTIRRHYSTDSCTSASHIAKELRGRGISISLAHLKRIRSKMGYHKANTKYCHVIREENKEKRMCFCGTNIEKNEPFTDCIFTDECTAQSKTMIVKR